MNPNAFLLLYLLVGVITSGALHVRRRTVAGQSQAVTAVLSTVLWPFVLPLIGAPVDWAHVQKSTNAIDQYEARLEAAFAGVNLDGVQTQRQRAGLTRFIARLRADERRLIDLRQAVKEAPKRARGPLEVVLARAEKRAHESLELLDQLTAQLTLLRFCEFADDQRDGREQVEDLLSRMVELCATEADNERDAGGEAKSDAQTPAAA